MGISELMEKYEFVQEMFEFYKNKVGNPIGIKNMYYVTDVNSLLEFVYVDFGGSFKRFSVWGDNQQGILSDFMSFLDNFSHFRWLAPEEVE